jgi:hypothetical protein
MTKDFLDSRPELMQQWSLQNPLGRIGRPDELRGVTVWLASDASTFCTGSEYVFRFFCFIGLTSSCCFFVLVSLLMVDIVLGRDKEEFSCWI